MTGKRHDFRVDYAVGFSREGGLRAVDVTLVGALRPFRGPVARRRRPHHVPRRQRLLLSVVPHRHPAHAHQHGVQHRLPRLRRPAGHALRRAHDGPHRLYDRARSARRAQGQLLRRRRPRPHALRHARRGQHPARARRRARTHQRLSRPPPGDRRVQRDEPGAQEGHRADAGEVRHLLHPHPPQPGRRAGPSLSRRLDQPQSRRHRDGAGALHQGRAGGGRGIRRRPSTR